MKKFLFTTFCAFSIVVAAQMSPQSNKITAKFFPDPDIEINTPAFLKKKGFTTYDELMAFIKVLQSKHSAIMTLNYLGTSQKGKQVPCIHLLKANGNENKIKVWLQGCLHGDEPASTEGLLFLLDRLLNDSSYAYLLDRLDISIIPVANVDGSEAQERVAANGLDLNRDQTKLMAPESIFLKKAFSEFNAEVAVDFHEYQPYRKDYASFSTYGVAALQDVMLMYSGNLNVPESLRQFTKSCFVENTVKMLDKCGLTHHDYFTSDKILGAVQITQGSVSARSSATSYALANTVASLIEVRGGGLGRTSYKRRVYTTFVVATSYLKTAYENVDSIKSEIEKAVASPAVNVVVKSKSPVSKQSLKMIDIETSNEIDIEVNLADAWLSKASMTRQRPTAYLLLPNQQLLVEKLKILGLEVQELKSSAEVDVENYLITECQKDSEETEGVHRQNVSTKTAAVKRNFPAGTFIVYLQQRKSNLAVEVLEPEAVNSFVSFCVLPVEKDQELPIYRYLSKTHL